MRNVLIVLILAAAVLLPALGKVVLTEHEVFAAEPAREMLAGGPIAYQQFAHQPRLQKPPGQSWLIAASAAVLGPTNVAARLPSAVAGAVAAVAATLIGTWAAGKRIGLISGLMMLTCVGVQQRTHLAEADMALACAVAVANAAVVQALCGNPSCRVRLGGPPADSADPSDKRSARADPTNAAIFWAAVVAGFLLKGPIVFGFTILPAAVCFALLRWKFNDARSSAVARSAFWWPAIVVGIAAILLWVVAVLHALPVPPSQALDRWKHEIGDRVAGGIRRDPHIAYVWLVPQATLPWIVFAFVAIGMFFRQKLWRDPAGLFLTCWGVCGALMVSAIAFKRMHYALPMLLPVIVLSAIGFERLLRWSVRKFPRAKRPALRTAALCGWFGLASAGWLINWFVIAPKLDPGPAVTHFAKLVNAAVPPGEPIYLVGTGQDRTSWYINRPLFDVTAMPAAGGYAIVQQNESDALICERNGQTLEVAEPYNLPSGHHDDDEREGERRMLVKVPASQPSE